MSFDTAQKPGVYEFNKLNPFKIKIREAEPIQVQLLWFDLIFMNRSE